MKTVKVWRETVNSVGKATKVSANMPVGMKFTGTPETDLEAGIQFYLKNGWNRVEPPQKPEAVKEKGEKHVS